MLNDTCAKFNTGNELHSTLCNETVSSADSALLSSIYQCVDRQGKDSFNVNGMMRLAHVAFLQHSG